MSFELPLAMFVSKLFVAFEECGTARRFPFDTGSPSMMRCELATGARTDAGELERESLLAGSRLCVVECGNERYAANCVSNQYRDEVAHQIGSEAELALRDEVERID